MLHCGTQRWQEVNSSVPPHPPRISANFDLLEPHSDLNLVRYVDDFLAPRDVSFVTTFAARLDQSISEYVGVHLSEPASCNEITSPSNSDDSQPELVL